MRKDDARKLDHKTLEQMRGTAHTQRRKPGRDRQGSGIEPLDSIRLAGPESSWWMEWVEGQNCAGACAQARWKKAQLDIQHGHAEDAAAAQVSICTVDLRDDRQADQGQIRDQALSPIDRPPAGAIRAVLSEAALSGAGARRGARQTMAEEGISGDQSPCLEGEGGDLFRRRRPCALGPPCRTDL